MECNDLTKDCRKGMKLKVSIAQFFITYLPTYIYYRVGEKCRKMVVMDTDDYVKNCKLHLNDKKLYEKLGADPSLNYIKVKQKTDDVLQK